MTQSVHARSRPTAHSPPAPGCHQAQPAAGRLEVRWFIPGTPSRTLWRPDVPPRLRSDAYHDDSLGPAESLKRRGPHRRLEHKRRLEHVEVTMLGQVVRAEAWVKERIDPVAGHTGSWTVVSKRIWRRRGIEIVDLGVDGERWWSVALTLGPDAPDLQDLRPLVEVAVTEGRSQSYPSWLLGRRHPRSSMGSASKGPGT